jgi:hypothetical protein
VILEFSLPPAPSEGGGDVFGVAPPYFGGGRGEAKAARKANFMDYLYSSLQSVTVRKFYMIPTKVGKAAI